MKQTVKTSRAAGQPEKDPVRVWSYYLFQGLAGRRREQVRDQYFVGYP